MTQQTVVRGSRMVIITEDMGRVTARLYLNHGDTASAQSWKGKTMAGAQRWAHKILPG
jgi:hypothetical protein